MRFAFVLPTQPFYYPTYLYTKMSFFASEFMSDLQHQSPHIDYPLKNMPFERQLQLLTIYIAYVTECISVADDEETNDLSIVIQQLHRYQAVILHNTMAQIASETTIMDDLTLPQHYERLNFQGQQAAKMEQRFKQDQDTMFRMITYLMWEFQRTVNRLFHDLLQPTKKSRKH